MVASLSAVSLSGNGEDFRLPIITNFAKLNGNDVAIL